MFIIRDMAFGDLLGEPQIKIGRFKWHDVDAWAESAPFHGAEYRPGSIVLQRLYQVVELTSGSGPSVSVGPCVYDNANDRVTRTTTFSDPALTGAAKDAAVNAEADRRLDLAYPETDQLWAALRASQLIWKKAVLGQNLTAGESTIMTAIDTAATFVNAVRSARLALIANGSLTTAQIAANANWPAQP